MSMHSKNDSHPSNFKQTVAEETDVHAFSSNPTMSHGNTSPTQSHFKENKLFAETISDSDSPVLVLDSTVINEEEIPDDTRTILPHKQKNTNTRTTILPEAKMSGEFPTLHLLSRERYEQVRELGEGAAGDVLLAKDNDIQRLVALKRLKEKHHAPASLARFIEEIQTVGQLEHPNIAPIHDVGIDENGQYYFVMKYVEGQTMADIIKNLADGDPETHALYTFEVRNQIFLKILQAVQFAHGHGIIHRDIKPENIMVGAYGQVMVMDWGIAKRIRNPLSGHHALPKDQTPPIEKVEQENALPTADPENTKIPTKDPERLFQTRTGTLIGTPAYMPPEQALGQTDYVDERSDIYSLSALYYEWMSLKHYLAHKTTISDLLWGIMQESPIFPTFLPPHPHQELVPAEFSHICVKGLAKDPGERYQSIAEMHKVMQLAMSGKFNVECSITMMKRGGNKVISFVDKHPRGIMFTGMVLGALSLVGSIQLGFWLVSFLA